MQINRILLKRLEPMNVVFRDGTSRAVLHRCLPAVCLVMLVCLSTSQSMAQESKVATVKVKKIESIAKQPTAYRTSAERPVIRQLDVATVQGIQPTKDSGELLRGSNESSEPPLILRLSEPVTLALERRKNQKVKAAILPANTTKSDKPTSRVIELETKNVKTVNSSRKFVFRQTNIPNQ